MTPFFRSLLPALALVVVAALPAVAAPPECRPAPGQRQTDDAIRRTLVHKGYKVTELGAAHGCTHAKVKDAFGRKIELYIHPNSGQVVRTVNVWP